MIVVGTLNGVFFRAITSNEEEIEITKQSMFKDQEGLEFEILTEEEYQARVDLEPKPPQPPTAEERLSAIEEVMMMLI